MKRFKIVRLQKGWSQLDLARAAGISESKLSKLETGRQEPDAALRKKLAVALDVPTWELFPAISKSEGEEVRHERG